MSFLSRLSAFLLPRPVIIDLQDYGPRLTWDQVMGLTQGRKNSEHIRLTMQLLAFQRHLCQQAVQDKSNVHENQTKFEAGGAASIADLMATLRNLDSGADNDPALNSGSPLRNNR